MHKRSSGKDSANSFATQPPVSLCQSNNGSASTLQHEPQNAMELGAKPGAAKHRLFSWFPQFLQSLFSMIATNAHPLLQQYETSTHHT